ncbi:MAG TPA: pyridoxamine 5'-phosphate oxidase family protein [Caulobacteraceae bacterium]|jgi:general stress protein 26
MTLDLRNPADLEHLLWDEIERRQVGMLMLVGGPPQHAQPMTAFVERDRRQLWFFADAEAEQTRNIGVGQPAMFIWQQHDIQACIGGRLAVRHDRERMDRYWNAVVAAWHPNGRNDPELTLLSLDCEEAQVWVATAGPTRTAWEIAKAAATHGRPEVSVSGRLDFH